MPDCAHGAFRVSRAPADSKRGLHRKESDGYVDNSLDDVTKPAKPNDPSLFFHSCD